MIRRPAEKAGGQGRLGAGMVAIQDAGIGVRVTHVGVDVEETVLGKRNST